MNIIIFTDTYLPKLDGISISIDRFSHLLAKRGHNFVICAPRYGNENHPTSSERIKILRFASIPLISYPDVRIVLPSIGKIKRAMRIWKADLVHVETPGLLGQYGAIAARLSKKPLVGTYHTLIAEQHTYTSLYRLLKIDVLLRSFLSPKKVETLFGRQAPGKKMGWKKRLIMKSCNSFYAKCNLIITPSRLIQANLINQGITTAIEVVSNGTSLEHFSGQAKVIHSPPKFLHVGRISYEKNCDVVVRAFALIQKHYPTATLDIIGDGPALQSLKVMVKSLDLSSNVVFHGMIEHERLCKLYWRYDIFLTASTMETQGLVVLEAMACGLPCIGVDAFALPELIQEGRNGFIVAPFDIKALASRAVQLAGDAALYRRFSTESLTIAKEHDIHACADRLEEVYRLAITAKADSV